MPAASGWGATFGGCKTAPWQLQAQAPAAAPGASGFGFTIAGAPSLPIRVQAAAELTSGNWTTLQTCTITNGSFLFTDPDSTQYSARFYRIVSP